MPGQSDSHATIDRSHGHDRPAHRRPTPRAEAGMAEGPRARVAELPAPQGADARPQPAHGVRGSALPQHRRVLEPRDGDVHDPRRRLHARLLRTARSRTAGRGRSIPRSRSASPTPSRRSASTTSSSPRWTATTCRTAARRSSPKRFARRARACRDCRIEVLIPDFQGQRGAAAHGARRRSRRAEPQHRDRAAALSHGALRRPLRAHAGAARSIAPLRAGHPDQDRR